MIERQDEERFRQAIRVSGIGIFDHDHLTDAVYWSAEQRMIYGWEPDEKVTLSKFLDQVYPEDRERITAAVRSAHDPAGDGKFDVDHRIIRRDGSIRWITTRSQTLFGCRDGRTVPIRTVGAVIDITGKKESETALRESEARLAEAQKIARLGYWERNMKTDAAWWSDECYRIFGMEPGRSDIDYQSFLNRIHRDDRKSIGDAVYAALRHNAPYDIEYRIVLPDQTERIIHSLAKVINDASGKPERLSGTVQDVTDQRKLEKEMSKAQKLESLGLLAGGIAHDFNNILTAVAGNISLARVSLGPDNAVAKLLAEAESASLRAKDLTGQLLTFAKGGTPVKTLKTIKCLVRDSAEFVLRGSNVRLEFSGSDELWPVEIDEGQIIQVVQNLVINARQAMPQGGVISISMENVPLNHLHARRHGIPQGNYLRVSVRDSGPGILPEHLNSVFDPFFTTKDKGSGLGLTTSYSIIQKHQGTIQVESKPGTGTRFSFYLPASTRPEPAPFEKKPDTIRFGCGRILLMDDDPSVRDIAGKVLEYLGYEVAHAPSGEAAVTLLRNSKDSGQPFALAILDLTVPGGISGEETMKRLLEIEPGLKAIVSSGYFDNPVLSNYRKYGFSGKIAKPFKVEELSSLLASLLQG